MIYRPYRENLRESMLEAREFINEDEMKRFIVKEYGYLDDDIVLGKDITFNNIIGWYDSRNIYAKRLGEKQIIGIYATKYKTKYKKR